MLSFQLTHPRLTGYQRASLTLLEQVITRDLSFQSPIAYGVRYEILVRCFHTPPISASLACFPSRNFELARLSGGYSLIVTESRALCSGHTKTEQ